MKPLSSLRIRIILSYMLFSLPAFAQVSWEALPLKFDYQFTNLRQFYIDPEDSTLLCLGDLRSVNGQQIGGILGIEKDQTLKFFPSISIFGSLGQCAIRWNGDLYVGGNNGLYKLVNNVWQILDSGSSVWCFYPYQGKLLIGGNLWYGNTIPHSSLVEFDGATFSKFKGSDSVISNDYIVDAITEYKGELYVAGSFNNFPPKDTRWKEIVRWTGTKWREVGNGIQGGGLDFVSSMQVLNGDLYVAGSFKESIGAPGNNIARWDGNSWSRLSPNITPSGAIYDLDVIGDTLLAAGSFNVDGILFDQGYAAFYKYKWCANMDTINNSVGSVINYFGNIIVGGGYTMIGADSFYRIAQVKDHGGCLYNAARVQNTMSKGIKVYPNPVLNEFYVELPTESPKALIKLYGIDGKLLHLQPIPQRLNTINLPAIARGMYFYQIEEQGKLLLNGKVIKE